MSSNLAIWRPLLFLVSVITACGAGIAPLAYAGDEQLVYPIFRFSISEEKKLSVEYIGYADGKYAGMFHDAPVAEGQMIVDCSDLWRIGLTLEPVGIDSWIYGANRKYRFRWTHSEYPGDSVRRMRYHQNRRTGQIEDWIGFDEKRAHWLVNGVVTVTVTVTKQVRFKTEFELQNCDANKFRSRIPPSDQFSTLEPETAHRIQSRVDWNNRKSMPPQWSREEATSSASFSGQYFSNR